MKVRLGYVSICTTIQHEKSFKTINYTNYNKTNDNNILKNIIDHNLDTLLEILKFNVNYNYIDNHIDKFINIRNYIKKNKLRCDVHPSEYTVLNSIKDSVIHSTNSILNYHKNILNILDINYPSIVLHVGSSVFGKDNSISRFVNSFNKLDKDIKKRIIVENDDKVFNICDVLKICEKLNIPMVLDYHHYMCNNNGKDLNDYIRDIFNTWNNSGTNPKIHYSSPKNNTKKDYRSHHDYVNADEFINFIESIKFVNRDIDIMIEAKKKDEALFKLVRELKYKTSYKFIDDTTFIV